ncbi:helix-turn-helix domain-containing protein [Undibacterium sp. Ren11W]
MDDTDLINATAPEKAEPTAYAELIGSRLGEPISSKLSQGAAGGGISSPGLRLMEARKALGWTVEAVAAQLYLATRQIRAMEMDDYAALPGLATTRGFVRSYAKLLKLDAAPLLALIPAESANEEISLINKRAKHVLPGRLLLVVAITVFALIGLIKYV